MPNVLKTASVILILLAICSAAGAAPTDASAALVHRVIPAQADQFDLQLIDADAGRDVFEIESVGNRIALRGNNGISIASALNWYLKYDCHCETSWCGDNLNLPTPLPTVEKKIRIVSSYPHRVAYNFCTFSYTMAFWDWNRWQREIDWLAMHGINMPLEINGEAAVWQATLRKYSMNDDEIRQFLCGPAFFAWQWMANLEGWGGPLPQTWIDSHLKLSQQILQRERELGMTPILSGFTGFVPRKLAEKYPTAKIQFKPRWCAVFLGAAQLDPLDPMFADFGKTYIQEQTKLLGTDHWYTADPFHESAPPSKDPAYLPAVAKTILVTMQSADPDAKIAMQTWSERAPIVQNIPPEKILLLDLEGHKWSSTDGFWGRPWVRGVIHNFGGRAFIGGNLPEALDGAAPLLHNPKAGHLEGVGFFPEGSGQNPIFYEAALETTWYDSPPDLKQWVTDYAHARYGSLPGDATDAWNILRDTVYTYTPDSLESPLTLRPRLAAKGGTYNGDLKRQYDPAALWRAWTKLQAAANSLGSVDTYQYDLVDVGRQCLADLTVLKLHDVQKAYQSGDVEKFKSAGDKLLEVGQDLDTLLATRQEFLLGKWISTAKQWGTTDAEKKQYEQNARWQVTVWGPDGPGAQLSDYSNRQWSGLLSGYYLPRWKRFLDFQATQISAKAPDPKAAAAFAKSLTAWEYQWCDGSESYPDAPVGDPVETSRRMLAKWQPIAAEAMTRFDLRKLKPIGVDTVAAVPVTLKTPAWTPADCSEDFRDWTLDVSNVIKTPGSYTVTFEFKSGRHALKIESVSLTQANRPPVNEIHDGWTGNESHGNSYQLTVPAYDPGTPCILKAHVATDAGTDSSGVIRIVSAK
jgi:alpha-N-acetylglucosaminidase